MDKLVIELDVPNELNRDRLLAFTEIAVSQLRADLDLSDAVKINIQQQTGE